MPPRAFRFAPQMGPRYLVLCQRPAARPRLAPPNMARSAPLLAVQAAKFVYFPSVYFFFVLRRKVPSLPRVPVGIVLFLVGAS